MKNYILIVSCLFYVITANAQNEQLYGKWNITELTSEGQTLPVERLGPYGLDKNFIEILQDGTFSMFDGREQSRGDWEYIKEGEILKLTYTLSAEDKANGVTEASDKFTVEEVNETFLVLKAGKAMTTKYKKE